MPPEYYWNIWPLEAYIFYLLDLRIEKIVGHLLGTWLGSENPWISIVTEPVIPKTFKYPREPRYREKDQEHLVAGALPKVYYVHVLNGGGSPTVCLAETAKIVSLGLVTVYDINYRTTLVRWEDHGDVMAGEPGGEVVIGPGHVGTAGYPGFPLRLPKWTQRSHLPELCAWLDRYVEDRDDGV
jgi:hypothetical protein